VNPTDEQIQGLLEALRATPTNVPLRLLLAETYLAAGQPEKAEPELKRCLQLQPENARAKLGLARACTSQGKNSVALVVLEDLVRDVEAPAQAFLLLARVALRQGLVEEAVAAYEEAKRRDETLLDEELELRLGRPEVEEQARDEETRAGARSLPELLASDDEEPSFVEGGRMRHAEEDGVDDGPASFVENPGISFSDVGGMETLKEEIRLKIILPMTNQELYQAYGKKAGGGILLYGPPGCGKTHLARATAGEVKASFVSVGLNDVLDMWIGQSEKRLHAIFEQARRAAPCVLFFDEVDALGASRSDMKRSGGRHLINQFLSELDGIGAANEGVLILAATNAPWHLDNAFRRPGRFDRVLFVPPPDQEARGEIMRLLLRDKPTEKVDRAKLAKRTGDFSGADLKAIVDLCVEEKLRAAMKSGKPVPIAGSDLLDAAKRTRATTKEWFATARNYALYANEGGLYDEILSYLGIE